MPAHVSTQLQIGRDLPRRCRDGHSPRCLTSCAGDKEGCASDYPEFSPDGKQIVFTHQDDYDGPHGINQQIWVMNADGSHAHAVTTGSEPKDQLPTWSPD